MTIMSVALTRVFTFLTVCSVKPKHHRCSLYFELLWFGRVAPWICVDWGKSGSVFRHLSSRWSWRSIRLPLVNVAPWKRFRGNFDTNLAFNGKALFPSSFFIWLVDVTHRQVLFLVTGETSCWCAFLCLSAALRTGPRPKEKRVSGWSLQLHAKKRWVAPCARACLQVRVCLSSLTMQSLLIFHWHGRGLFFMYDERFMVAQPPPCCSQANQDVFMPGNGLTYLLLTHPVCHLHALLHTHRHARIWRWLSHLAASSSPWHTLCQNILHTAVNTWNDCAILFPCLEEQTFALVMWSTIGQRWIPGLIIALFPQNYLKCNMRDVCTTRIPESPKSDPLWIGRCCQVQSLNIGAPSAGHEANWEASFILQSCWSEHIPKKWSKMQYLLCLFIRSLPIWGEKWPVTMKFYSFVM